MAKFRVYYYYLLFVCMMMMMMSIDAVLCEWRKVGGRTPVKNVEDNQEIQELGRFCVRQYNINIGAAANGTSKLVFDRVVAAETQVVSGIKYFLKISAGGQHGTKIVDTFEAVVVVKPWLHSKELLSFSPATTPSSFSS